jgi:hypothetical protein
MRRLTGWLRLALLACVVSAIDSHDCNAAKPQAAEVARRVDESLAKELLGPGVDVAPRCDDATFLRRAWLDIVGDIPTPEHVIAFSLDTRGDKRERLVRELLADPQYGLNWARYWRDVIFYRRIEERALIAANSLEADLSQRFDENVPWNRVAEEFITATGDVRENGATAIIMAQEGRTEETTAEVARIFLGMQIQCAQCHDHPYDRWKREDFHELAAFFPRIGVRPVQSPTKRSFQVMASDRRMRIAKNDDGNRPTPEHMMPDLEDPSAPGTQMQPTFFLTTEKLPVGSLDVDRRETLAKWLTENPWFATAAVNRMWAELVGEGFYEPVDDIGPDRKPRAPETAKLLSAEFRRSGYDMKWLVETICATEAYQRQSRPRGEGENHVPFAASVPQPLRADQLYNVVSSALDVSDEEPQEARRGGGGGLYRRPGKRGQFNLTFGYDPSEPRETITGSIPQALGMMNSPQGAGGLKANRGMLAGLLSEIDDNEELLVDLYLRTLSRQPTADELARGLAYLDEVGDRKEAVEDMAWALMNSAEFRHRR